MTDDELVVPEGHRVNVFGPSPDPFLARTDSGVWMLELGDGRNFTEALDSLEHFVSTTTQQSVIWIVQAELLEQLTDPGGFVKRVSSVMDRSRGTTRHCAVFVTRASERTDVMRAFKELGLGVHYSAPDGACFVEVHRPDGIVVGMPGPAFDGA